MTMDKQTSVLIVSHDTSEGQLVVGAAASDQWAEPFGADGDQVVVPVDSPLLLANPTAGWTVDASNKNLKLAASGGDVDYSIAILGAVTASGSGSGA